MNAIESRRDVPWNVSLLLLAVIASGFTAIACENALRCNAAS